MNFIRQFAGILRVSLSGVTERVGSVLTILIGIACSVGVLVSMLAMGAGAREQEVGDARPDRIVLNSVGAQGIESSIPREEAAVALNLPHVKKDTQGEPIVVFESFVPSEGNRRVTGNRIFLPLVGITANVTAYLPEMRFTGGRMFQRGLHELIASNRCARQFTDFEIGDRRSIHGNDWTVVGHFDQGRSQQCVVYADVDTIMSTFSRNTYSQVLMMLPLWRGLRCDSRCAARRSDAAPRSPTRARGSRGAIQATELAVQFRQLLHRHDHGGWGNARRRELAVCDRRCAPPRARHLACDRLRFRADRGFHTVRVDPVGFAGRAAGGRAGMDAIQRTVGEPLRL